MLCSRFRQILFSKPTINSDVQCRCIVTARLILKQCRLDEILALIIKNRKEVHAMSSARFILRDFGIRKLRSVWNRGLNVGNVVRRYRKDRRVRDVILCFRQAFLRPRRTLLLSATAAYKAKDDGDDVPPGNPPCDKNITDEDLEALLSDLEVVQELTKLLYCPKCNKRLVIEKPLPGIKYCDCKETQPPKVSDDGWEPYMEAEDVIIWRKEYKPGQGLYAYRVYGRYVDVKASHFAAVQVDSAYRREWDSAVAALAVVETSDSVPDQAVLHWEVLWPRLFANRDYVYLRRHKEFNLITSPVDKPIISTDPIVKPTPQTVLPKTTTPINIPLPSIITESTAAMDKPVSNNAINESTTPGETVPAIEKSTPDQDKITEANVPVDNRLCELLCVPLQTGSAESSSTVKEPVPNNVSAKSTATVVVPPSDNVKSSVPVNNPPPATDTTNQVTKPVIDSATKSTEPDQTAPVVQTEERPSVHSNAKRKAIEAYSKLGDQTPKDNKVYAILSRSCVHPDVPETRHAIRVSEYWSHMVVKTLDGTGKVGMEFVLTYYDEPAVGGLPSGVASWATGRAAPAYLIKMRQAAKQYEYTLDNGPEAITEPAKVSYKEKVAVISEQDMESSKQGPELENCPSADSTKDKSTQTEYGSDSVKVILKANANTLEKSVGTEKTHSNKDSSELDEEEGDKSEEETSGRWWRYLHPYYYFV